MNPGFQDRRKRAALRITPQHWIDALAQAERLARAACDLSGIVSPAGDLVQFRIRVAEMLPESFPAPSDHARSAAAAFLFAGRAFADVRTEPEARTACAPLLREAAAYVDQLLTLYRTGRAAGWQRQFRDL